MLNKEYFKRWYIKICRHILRIKFLRIMAGPLKSYLWSTRASYEYILGNYEDVVTLKQFLNWLNPGSVFFDVGANVGFHAIAANRIISTGKIYAFEPMPAVRENFEKHISVNCNFILDKNIVILPFAISETEKEVEFWNVIKHRDGNTYIKEPGVFSGAKNKIKVQCHSIDGLIQAGYEKPDIIKIDVEGAEYDVLQGAKNTIQQYQPNILLATHDCHLPGVQKECVHFLEELGYQLTHTGKHNKNMAGLDDYIAIHKSKL